MADNGYKLNLRCANCGTRFEKEFGRGFEVSERGVLIDYHEVWDEENKPIECPYCGNHNVRKVLFD